MYCSERPDGYEDFASVALKNGFLEFRFDTGSGKEKEMFFQLYMQKNTRDNFVFIRCFDFEKQ